MQRDKKQISESNLLRDYLLVKRGYQAIFDQTAAFIIGLDRAGAIAFFNQATQRALGYTEEEAIGKDFGTLLLPPEKRSLGHFGSPGWEFDFETPVHTKEKDTLLIRWHIIPISIVEEQILGYVGFGFDFTEERKREFEFARLAQMNRRILDAIPISILMLDENLTVLDANRHYLECRRKNVPPIWGHIRDIFSPDLMEGTGLEEALKECLRTGAPKQINEMPHKAESHESRWLNLRIYPLEKFEPSGSDSQPRLILAIDDVTSYVKMRNEYQAQHDLISLSNKELQRALEQLRATQVELLRSEKLASVGQLAAGVAHEINNPIAYVLSNMRTLSQYLDDINVIISKYKDLVCRSGNKSLVAEMEDAEKRCEAEFILKDSASIIEENVSGALRIRDIVRDLSTFSRADIGKVGRVDVNKIIESAIKVIYNEVIHHARLRTKLNELPEIFADSGQLGQVFLNIILNAGQSMPEGHADSNTVIIESRLEGEDIVVSVKDTGSGIPPENLPKIFDPFFTTKEVGEGSGLGLPISLNLVRQHGGDIQVKSEAGKGSTFKIILPIETGLQDDDIVVDDEPGEDKAQVAQKPRVLLIDDNERIIKSYARILKPHNELVTAQGGQKGIELLARDQNFDAILCDMMMPDTDGIEVYEFLMKNQPRLAARVIFFTGGAFTARTKKFIDNVPNNVLEKPVDFILLRSLIKRMAQLPRSPLSA